MTLSILWSGRHWIKNGSFGRSLCPRLAVVVLNLGSEVVADVADVADLVLHDQGDVRRHGQTDGGSEARGLGEQVQVAASERQGHWLL